MYVWYWIVVLPNDSNSLLGLPNLSDSKQMMYTSTDDSISIDDNHLGSVSKGGLQLVERCSSIYNALHNVFKSPKPWSDLMYF